MSRISVLTPQGGARRRFLLGAAGGVAALAAGGRIPASAAESTTGVFPLFA